MHCQTVKNYNVVVGWLMRVQIMQMNRVYLFKDYFDFINTKFNCKFIGCRCRHIFLCRLTERSRFYFYPSSFRQLASEAVNALTHAVSFTLKDKHHLHLPGVRIEPIIFVFFSIRFYQTWWLLFSSSSFEHFFSILWSSVSLTKISHRH